MGFPDFFKEIPDPRMERKKLHSLSDILSLTIIAVICGAESWISIEDFGNAKLEFLKSILDLPNGIPSHDTIERLFKRLNPKHFETVFKEFVLHLGAVTKGMIVNVDGKVLRGSQDNINGKGPINMVSAWVGENQLVFAQVKVDGKSNEITALHKLIKILDLEGSILTIDAIGCQKDITQEIVDAKGDYVIGLKGNQGSLHEEVKSQFSFVKPSDFFEKLEKSHGRIETRKCSVIDSLDFLDERKNWPTMKSVVRIESTREIKGKATTENRYYISSLIETAEKFNEIIRGHWSIENSFHWVLDMAFREDESRKRKDNAAENFAYMRRLALNLLKKDKSNKLGLNNRRLKAGWDMTYLLKILEF